tara:strand:+ start:3027 stop:3815 length:789 start_codon:yes stop_codon:yes gene_type:complete
MTSKGTHGGGDSGPAIAGDPSTFPSDAELSRTLVASSTTASLSTLTESGYPYGSIVSYIPNDDGDPVILVSDLAEHTINARSDSKASMLIAESADGGDPLGKSRLTLVGRLSIIKNPESIREKYLQRHKHASFYVDYNDFNFWKLTVDECRFVGGFGHMSWVTSEDYRNAEVDPLFENAAGVIDHMNDDHSDANLMYVQALGKLKDSREAMMLGIDRYGITLRALTPDGPRMVRIGFPSPLTSSEEARPAIIALLDLAKSSL